MPVRKPAWLWERIERIDPAAPQSNALGAWAPLAKLGRTGPRSAGMPRISAVSGGPLLPIFRAGRGPRPRDRRAGTRACAMCASVAGKHSARTYSTKAAPSHGRGRCHARTADLPRAAATAGSEHTSPPRGGSPRTMNETTEELCGLRGRGITATYPTSPDGPCIGFEGPSATIDQQDRIMAVRDGAVSAVPLIAPTARTGKLMSARRGFLNGSIDSGGPTGRTR
jgi:hypothetical protein